MKFGKALVGLAVAGIAMAPVAASAGTTAASARTSAAASLPSFSGAARYTSTSVQKSNKALGALWVPVVLAGAAAAGGVWAVADNKHSCASPGTGGC